MIKEDLRKSIEECKMCYAKSLLEQENRATDFSEEEINELAGKVTAIIFCNLFTKENLMPYVRDFQNVEFYVSKAMPDDKCYISAYKKEMLLLPFAI